MRTILALLLLAFVGAPLAGEDPPADPSAVGFINKVWKVVESPAGATGQLYVFLSDGTLVKTSPDAVPELGKWSFENSRLKILEGGIMYEAEIRALNDRGFTLAVFHGPDSYKLRFVPAEPALPVRPVEFNPAELSIGAGGGEPFWSIRVEGSSARLRMPDEGTLEFAGGRWEAEDAASWGFTAFRELEAGTDSLTLIIRTERCVGESNAEYLLSAMLIRKGARMDGCAVAGRLRAGYHEGR